MIKVALVRVPTLIDPTSFIALICPPIGLAYLKASLRDRNVDIKVVDAVGNHPLIRRVALNGRESGLLGQTAEEIAEAVEPDTDIIAISIMFSSDWPYARKTLSALRQRCPKAAIIAGSEHITAAPEFSMTAAPEIDLCVLGEGETVLAELVEHYQKNGVLADDVQGTCVRVSGGFKRNARQARIKDLESIPWPDWKGFPLDNYFSGGHNFGVDRGRSMPILATRGCPYSCTFCSSPLMWTTVWKAREPGDVVAEMKHYMAEYKATNFDFYDLTAIIKKDWIVDFAQMLVRERLNITWQLPSGTRSEVIDRDVAKLLYASGCRNFVYAPESGSPEILQRIKKKIQLSRMLESMRNCVKENISIKVNIIGGFPGEKWSNLLETLWFIAKTAWVGVDDLAIYQFSPYPGSELFSDLEKAGKIKMDDAYFERLSFQSSMTRAHSFSEHLSGQELLFYKYAGTILFYLVSFLRWPSRLVRLVRNVMSDTEATRLDKVVKSYLIRFGVLKQRGV